MLVRTTRNAIDGGCHQYALKIGIDLEEWVD